MIRMWILLILLSCRVSFADSIKNQNATGPHGLLLCRDIAARLAAGPEFISFLKLGARDARLIEDTLRAILDITMDQALDPEDAPTGIRLEIVTTQEGRKALQSEFGADPRIENLIIEPRNQFEFNQPKDVGILRPFAKSSDILDLIKFEVVFALTDDWEATYALTSRFLTRPEVLSVVPGQSLRDRHGPKGRQFRQGSTTLARLFSEGEFVDLQAILQPGFKETSRSFQKLRMRLLENVSPGPPLPHSLQTDFKGSKFENMFLALMHESESERKGVPTFILFAKRPRETQRQFEDRVEGVRALMPKMHSLHFPSVFNLHRPVSKTAPATAQMLYISKILSPNQILRIIDDPRVDFATRQFPPVLGTHTPLGQKTVIFKSLMHGSRSTLEVSFDTGETSETTLYKFTPGVGERTLVAHRNYEPDFRGFVRTNEVEKFMKKMPGATKIFPPKPTVGNPRTYLKSNLGWLVTRLNDPLGVSDYLILEPTTGFDRRRIFVIEFNPGSSKPDRIIKGNESVTDIFILK